MGVDYRKQYTPDQLEPFWPNEIFKMVAVVLCVFALIMLLAVLPVLLEMLGIEGVGHEEQPANPRGGTPVGIKPEWYFLAVYQYLKLMPSEFLGISGKTWGVLSQGPVALVIVMLPFWYRRRADHLPSWLYRLTVTGVIVAFVVLTIFGGWPEHAGEHGPEHATAYEYLVEQPFMFGFGAATLIVFYFLIWHERRDIRRLMHTKETHYSAEIES